MAVIWMGEPMTQGSFVDVIGPVSTLNGERCIIAEYLHIIGSPLAR